MSDRPDGDSRLSRRGVLSALSATALASLAGCSVSMPGVDVSVGDGGPTATPTPTATLRPTDEPTAEPTTAAPTTYAPGETVELTQEETTIDVAVVDHRLTDAYRSQSDTEVTAPSGDEYLFVEVEVTNTGSEDGAAPTVDVKPTSGDSERPEERPAWMSGDWYPRSPLAGALATGATIRGWIRVRVPAGTDPSAFRVAFSPDILVTEDEYRWTLV